MHEQDLTPDRFATLADAYGGDLRRWPEAERRAAEALLARGDLEIAAILARANAVDAMLDSYSIVSPSSALVGHILASAVHSRRLWSRARLWWSGLGLAGIGFAGAMAGALAISLALPAIGDHHAAFADEATTAFDDVELNGTEL